MPVAALDAGQSPAGTGLGRAPASGRATKGGEIPAMPVAALDAGQRPAGTGLGRTPAGGRATKGGEIPAVVAVVTGRDSGYARAQDLHPRKTPL